MSGNALIYVYGTLMNGGRNSKLLKNSTFITEAKISGVAMLDNGYYPMLIEGKGNYIGEVYEVTPDQLREVDMLEGYNERRPENSMYLRVETDVIADNGELYHVYYYKWNRDLQYLRPVESGTRWEV